MFRIFQNHCILLKTSQTSSPWKTYQSPSTGEVLCLCIMWPNLSLNLCNISTYATSSFITHSLQTLSPSHILIKQYLNSCDIQCFKSVGAHSPQSNHCIFSNKVLSSKMCPTHSFLGSCKLTVPREAESPISTVTYMFLYLNRLFFQKKSWCGVAGVGWGGVSKVQKCLMY